MKTLLYFAVFSCAASPYALIANDSVTTEHKPNAYTTACLEAPTQDCAFKAALQTVIEEDFGVDRAKVLVGVAEAMIKIGQSQQAAQTLMVALDEARSVNLSPVTQEKITSIAPLLSKAGDVASALALTEELTQDTTRDRVLFRIAKILVQRGDLADAKATLDQASRPSTAFWKYLEFLTTAPKGALSDLEFEQLVAEVSQYGDAAQKYRGLVRLAIIADRMGRAGDRAAYLAEAEELFSSIVSFSMRAEATGERARLMHSAGMDPAFVTESYDLAIMHGARVRSLEAQANVARNLGPIEAASGDIIKALKWMVYLNEVDDKAAYLVSLPAEGNSRVLATEMRALLVEIKEVEGAYNRDLIRLTLLNGAIRMSNQQLATQIIAELEDDDNQALGLVRMAPLLS